MWCTILPLAVAAEQHGLRRAYEGWFLLQRSVTVLVVGTAASAAAEQDGSGVLRHCTADSCESELTCKHIADMLHDSAVIPLQHKDCITQGTWHIRLFCFTTPVGRCMGVLVKGACGMHW